MDSNQVLYAFDSELTPINYDYNVNFSAFNYPLPELFINGRLDKMSYETVVSYVMF